jgi:hypothetical protein
VTGVLCAAIASNNAAPASGISVSAPDINISANVGVVASGNSLASVSGGSGSYSYSWATSGALIDYAGTSSATLSASKPSTMAGSRSGSATVTVTDTVSGKHASATISVFLENTA